MPGRDVILFGPFRLIPAERLLLRGEDPIDVGSRALDILVALAEAAGEVVGQRELMNRGWPNVVVGEGSLRVTIAELRRALGDGKDGIRYIANVTGRGYCLVTPAEREGSEPARLQSPPPASPSGSKRALPPRLARMIGRERDAEALSALLASKRFVSVVGPGGLGKTTLAVSIAHTLREDFADAVYFVDLGAVSDPKHVMSSVSSALGFFLKAEDSLPSLAAFLSDRRILLVLDSCEHVIEACALLAERIYTDAPEVYILTTSREALRAEGEYVHLLPPLDCPILRDDLTAAEALASPAVQLFMERAFAGGYTRGLTDADAPVVAAICSRLDGVALAIELAAGRVRSSGLQGTAELLNNRFRLLWQGRRSALPRHQTLHAMLDWSFNLLSDRDQQVLCRLSVFVGPFTLEAAQVVAGDDEGDGLDVAEAIANLIDKSLVWVGSNDGVTFHRLLDSTLAFANEKLAQRAEANSVARRHAIYYSKWQSGDGAGGSNAADAPTRIEPHIGNILAALVWCFSDRGDTAIGVQLAAASVHLFFELSLIVECVRWCEEGLSAMSALADQGADNSTVLVLQAYLAASAMFTKGNTDEVRQALEAGLRLADALGDYRYQLSLLAGQSIFLTRIGDFQGALAVARRSIAIAQEIPSAGAAATAEWMAGVAYHLAGDQALARHHCERGMAGAATAHAAEVDFFGYDHRIRALIALARCYWLMGLPDRAAKTARRALDEAGQRDHPVNLCMALIYTSTVFLWRGDIDEAELLIRRLIACASRHSLGPYHTVGQALTAEVEIARGRPRVGVTLMRRALRTLQAESHNVLSPAFHSTLASGLMDAGDVDEAAAVLDSGLDQSQTFGETLNVPELRRLRGEAWLRTGPSDPAAAEREFQLSMQLANSQASLSQMLRTATSLARMWAGQGKVSEAIEVLGDIRQRFEEGFQTKDLIAADQLLAALQECPSLFSSPAAAESE